MQLPIASETDFHGGRRPPHGVDPQQLRIIKDTALRARLIQAGLAEGLQSPKGPQKIPSILRIYPSFDAPRPPAPQRRGPRQSRSGEAPERRAYGLPSVEELNTLLARIQTVERQVSQELQGRLSGDIDRLKRELAHLEGDAFERAFRELDAAMRQRRELAAQVREEAFRRIEADGDFAPRRYLRLIAREPKPLA